MLHSKTRYGATLTEVLVAIFVMAIGLLALLTLFPLGALSMAQAIKDDRTAHAAKNAFAIIQALNFQSDATILDVRNPQNLLGAPLTGIGVYQQFPPVAGVPNNSSTPFLNPYPDIAQPQPANAITYWLPPDLGMNPAFANADQPSYPIYVDPFVWKNFGKSYRWVGFDPNAQTPWNPFTQAPPAPLSGLLPRLPLSDFLTTANSSQWLDRWCTLSDDLTFSAGRSANEPADAGAPSLSTGLAQRENRYTWAWLLRRPNASDASTIDVTIVVYSGRSVTNLGESLFLAGVNPNTGNITTGVWFDPNSKFVDIAWPAGAPKPSIRTGSWILDATLGFAIPPAGPSIPDPHGFFYRVVGTTDLSGNSMRLELQTYPKKASFYATSDTGAYGVLVVMENVAEVFP